MKETWKPGTLIYPLPAILVSSGSTPDDYNMFTVAWVGTLCTNPPMCYVSIRPERHSYELIKRNMEFTLNLTTVSMAQATDWSGVRSGKDYNKWKETGLTPVPGVEVRSPYIEESPLSIECKVREIVALGSHDMFIADVVNILADSKYIDPETQAFDMQRADLMVYSHGHYYELGNEIGKFGWSVKKK
ncbi:MAG: flavin reductase family protein [Muribaculaceae bacterium]|nr:flavin reductase family protein [Muribaculaceae bacterium]